MVGGAPQPLLTVLTTNDAGKIPPELYRSGRLDDYVVFEKLKHTRAIIKLWVSRSHRRDL